MNNEKKTMGRPPRGVQKVNTSLKVEKVEILKKYAKQRNMPVSYVIEELIDTHLAHQIKEEN